MNDTVRTPDDNFPRDPIAFDDRARRVMELRKQVREGTYRVDAEEVAKAIIREWAATDYLAVPDGSLPRLETRAERLSAAARFVIQPTTGDVGESGVLSA